MKIPVDQQFLKYSDQSVCTNNHSTFSLKRKKSPENLCCPVCPWMKRIWCICLTQRVVRTAERIICTTLPTLQELYLSRVSKKAGKITLDHSHPAHSSLNCYRLVDATELWAPERPDTETISSLRQSISWTRDIKRGTHNTIIFITHTHNFYFKFAHIRPVHT